MTTDREAERRNRVRERAYYLSQARRGPPDPVADWIEAEAAEAAAGEAAAETASAEPIPPEPPEPDPPAPEPPATALPAPEPPAPDPLARYPHLAAVVAKTGAAVPPAGLRARLEHAARTGDHQAIDRLERDLAQLAGRLAPAALAGLGDELVRTTGDDVQAGLSWDLAAMQIHLFAALSRRDCLKSIDVRPAWSVAARYRCTIGAKGASLSVDVHPDFGTGSPALGTEGGAPSERAATDDGPESTTAFPRHLLPPFKKLLESRAKEDAPFLLATVQLPPASGEAEATAAPTLELVAKKASAGAASLANSASSLWLGLLELDLRAESPRLRLVVRPAASWPLPYRDLAGSLDASIAVL